MQLEMSEKVTLMDFDRTMEDLTKYEEFLQLKQHVDEFADIGKM